jgi:hypothetical protein
MGAAYFEVSGAVSPELLADNMDMQYNYNNGITRIIVSSIQGNDFEGAFINLGNADVISVELATAEGAPVVAKTIPANYSLNQNYPNPFNPSTEISFSLASAGEWTVSIYNVTGQKVSDFSGTSEAGPVNLTWDASDNASGVYFYKLTAGDFSATKKMVLLK